MITSSGVRWRNFLLFFRSFHVSQAKPQGLTAKLYWEHKHEILEASRTELPHLISTLVSEGHLTHNGNPPSPITKVNGHILICTTSDFLSRDFIQTYDLKSVAFLLLTSKDEVLPVFSNETTTFQVHVIGGKKGHMQFLKQVLPHSMDYIRRQLRCGKRICVVCNTGHDISVGVALSALQKFFDDEGNYVPAELHTTGTWSFCFMSFLLLLGIFSW